MKIKDIKALEVSVPIENQKKRKTVNLVVVTTNEGITGIGELRRAHTYVCLVPSYERPSGIVNSIVESCLKPLLIGCNPFDIESLFDKMYRATQNVGQRGLMIIAISGVEQALWDIIGKAAKQPVYNLIGGCVHKDIEAYASLGRYPTVNETVKGAIHYIDMGFKAIKLHQREIESSKALRIEVGEDVKIMLDVNGLWTPDVTIKKAKELADYNITWLECPVYPQDDIDGTARVTAIVGDRVPICAGENEYTIWGFKNIIDKKAVNVINLDPVKCGGLWQAKKIAALAEVERILCAPHSACSEVGLETALHLTTSTPNCTYAEVWGTVLDVMEGLTESVLAEPLKIENGFIKASSKPGFGIELNWKVIDKYTIDKR